MLKAGWSSSELSIPGPRQLHDRKCCSGSKNRKKGGLLLTGAIGLPVVIAPDGPGEGARISKLQCKKKV